MGARFLGKEIMRTVHLEHVPCGGTLPHHNRNYRTIFVVNVLVVVNVEVSLWILNFFRVFSFLLTDEQERLSVGLR